MEQGIECCKINWQTTNMKGMKNFNNALKFFFKRGFPAATGVRCKAGSWVDCAPVKIKKGITFFMNAIPSFYITCFSISLLDY